MIKKLTCHPQTRFGRRQTKVSRLGHGVSDCHPRLQVPDDQHNDPGEDQRSEAASDGDPKPPWVKAKTGLAHPGAEPG
jgi:hypothetical protein